MKFKMINKLINRKKYQHKSQFNLFPTALQHYLYIHIANHENDVKGITTEKSAE